MGLLKVSSKRVTEDLPLARVQKGRSTHLSPAVYPHNKDQFLPMWSVLELERKTGSKSGGLGEKRDSH